MPRVHLTIKDYGKSYAPVAAAEYIDQSCVVCARPVTEHTSGLLTIGGTPVHTACAGTIGE